MRPDGIVVTAERAGGGERLARLMAHWGVRPRLLPPGEAAALLARRPRAKRPAFVGIALSDAVAAEASDAPALGEISRLAPVLLVHGALSSAVAGRVLASLTGGVVTGMLPPRSASVFEVSSARPALAGPLSGARLGPTAGSRVARVRCSEPAGSLPLILADGVPFFVEVRGEGPDARRVYVLGGEELLGLDVPVDRLRDVASLPGFVPVVMALKAAYGDGVWHASASYASVVVDDPLLRPRYGPLDYGRLVREMDEAGYATSVAFIPFNRGRTRASTAALFRERADRLSVCVHGCDHTRGEFGTSDPERLRGMIAAARARMDDHRARHGLEHDDVMVFPQGVFSAAAVRALRDEGFASAVNSGPKAADDERELTVRDFLDVAVRRYGGFPVLVRRALDDPDVAGDLFVGRPALLVVHPRDLAAGDGRLREVVGRMNALDGGLLWRGLGEISSELNVQRLAATGRLHVRPTSPRATLRNGSAAERRTMLVVWDDPDGAVTEVTASFGRVPFRRRAGKVFFRMDLEPGAEERVVIATGDPSPPRPLRRPAGERVRIAMRRRLSEIRDTRPGPIGAIRRVVGG